MTREPTARIAAQRPRDRRRLTSGSSSLSERAGDWLSPWSRAMLLAMSAHSDEIDLSDVRLFADGTPHAVFRRLRRESPVYWNEGTEGTGFWALTRHADVLEVSRDSERFSSEQHGIMIYDESFETSGRERTMLERDAPQHTRLRALVSRGMTGRRVLELEAFARDSFAKILDRAQEMGRCDFVEDVASQLPLQIITEMMGIPESDRGPLGVLANRVQGFDDPDLGGGDGPGENSAAISEMSDYALELGRARRRQPRDDIATWILEAKVEGYAMNDAAFAAFFMLLITAGIETTKSAVSGGMLALMEHPGQWANLGRDPQALPAAIEEMIRWTTPIHHFRRTATRDTEIRGQAIGRGDRVVVWYSSANRDESVFEDPDRFDIGREPNEHLAFGFGRHFCLGASLARMEIRVVFESLLARGIEVESLGPFDYMLSSFTNSLKRMPVALRTNG